MIIQELAYKVSLQAGDFLAGKRKVESESTELANTLERNNKNTKAQFAGLSQGAKQFGDAGKNAFSLVQSGAARFLGVALTLEGARRLFLGTTDQLVRLGNAAGFMGMSTQSLDGFNRTAQAAGVSADSMGAALMRLKNAQLTVQTGMGDPQAVTPYRILEGNSATDILGAKDPGQMLIREAQALRKLPLAQAQSISGQIGNDPALFQAMLQPDFEKNVAKYTGRSDATPAAVKQAQQVKQVLTDLQQTVDNLGITMLQVFGPDITKGLQLLSDWIRNNKGDITGFFTDLSNEAKTLTDAVGGIGNLLKIYAGWKVGGVYGAAVAAGSIPAQKIADAVKKQDHTDSFWDSVKQRWNSGGWYNNEIKNNKGKNLKVANFPSEGDLYDMLGGWISKGYFAANDTVNDAGKYLYHQLLPEAGAAEIRPNFSGSRLSLQSNTTENKLLDAVQMTESGGNPLAYNVKSGATGAYQLMPGTARDLGLTVNDKQDDRLDEGKSRAAASSYLSQLLKRYHGNVSDALQAYNWGPGNMDKYIAGGRTGFIPKETKDYPNKVAGYYGRMLDSANASPTTNNHIVDQSQSNSTHIETVNVTTPAQTVDQLSYSIQQQAARSSVTVSFSGGAQ